MREATGWAMPMNMSKGDNLKQQNSLASKRDALLRNAWRQVEDAADGNEVPADSADRGSRARDRDIAVAIAESECAQAGQIETALRHMDSGTYGLCRICGRQIRRARLKAVPWATRCVRCQRQAEQAGASP